MDQSTLHLPLSTSIAPSKEESIDYLLQVPPRFYSVAPPITVPESVWLAASSSLIVAVFQNTNQCAVSSDTVNWTLITLPVSGLWSSIAYGNGLFVIVDGASSNVLVSSDGHVWTLATQPMTEAQVVAYGNGYFVLLDSETNLVCRTADGVNYTSSTMPSTDNWQNLCYGATAGLWVAVAFNSSGSATSPDGLTWTALAMTAVGAWSGVASNGTGFVAITDDASGLVNTSTNGTSWVTATWDKDYYAGITYGSTQYFAVAESSGDTEFSTNGTTYSYAVALPSTYANASDVIYFTGTGAWVVSQTASPIILSNTSNGDNGSWAVSSIAGASFGAAAWGNGLFVGLLGSASATYYTSADGFTWAPRTFPAALQAVAWSSIAWGYDRFVAIPTTGTLAAWSLNGTEWYPMTLPATFTIGGRVIYGNGNWLIYPAAGTGLVSTDGVTWKTFATSNTGYVPHLAVGNNLAVATYATTASVALALPVAAGGSFRTASTLPKTGSPWSVAYGRGVFVAILQTNPYAALSVDGLTWKGITLPAALNVTPTMLIYAFGLFIAIGIGATGTGLVSPDGINWRTFPIPFTNFTPIAIAASPSRLVVLGSDGSIMSTGDMQGAHFGTMP